jgi:curved DNA-binding protein
MDHYTVLGVHKSASEKEIKTAFRRLAGKHHPDKGGDHKEFIKIKEAYEVLSDPQQRQQYDNTQPQNQHRGGFGYDNINPDMQDIFGNMFRQSGTSNPFQQPARRNKDITIAAKIELEDVLTGKNLIASYTLRTGKKETVDIEIPPGIRSGDVIKYSGLGDDILQLQRGDLHVKIEILNHKDWQREGMHLYREYKVNALDLIVGCSIIVHTLDGKQLNLKVPTGTQSNGRFNIAQHGLPDRRNGQRGNAYIIVTATIPKISNPSVLKQLTLIKNIINNETN